MRHNPVLLLLATVFAGGAIIFAADKYLNPANDPAAALAIQPTYANIQFASNDATEDFAAEENQNGDSRHNRYDPVAAMEAEVAAQLNQIRE